MLANWEAEKARVLQEELGVTDDELSKITANGGLGSSVLGRSALGSSTRRVSWRIYLMGGRELTCPSSPWHRARPSTLNHGMEVW